MSPVTNSTLSLLRPHQRPAPREAEGGGAALGPRAPGGAPAVTPACRRRGASEERVGPGGPLGASGVHVQSCTRTREFPLCWADPGEVRCGELAGSPAQGGPAGSGAEVELSLPGRCEVGGGLGSGLWSRRQSDRWSPRVRRV